VTERPRDLPDFTSPPLEEVAMSVQFEPIPAFGARMQAQVWARFRERFPEWVEQQVLPPTFELFGIPDRPHHLIQLAAQLFPPTSRALFVDEKKTELLQLQSDRFVRN
jgi:uncharacterized protein (TIGR04255 family)